MKILVISDIHGNAEALRAVVDAEDGIDHTIFLGDALPRGAASK
ncbi:MAG: metallophosphoesterase [Luminiphilus sp.]